LIWILQNTGWQRPGQINHGKTGMQNNKASLNIPELDLKVSLETGTSHSFVSPLFPSHGSRVEAFWHIDLVMWLIIVFEDIIAMSMNYWKHGKTAMSVVLRMRFNAGGYGIIVPYWDLNNTIMRLRGSQGPRCVGWLLDGHWLYWTGTRQYLLHVYIYMLLYSGM